MKIFVATMKFKIFRQFLGLAGKLHTNLEDGLGGEYSTMDESDLLAIDREGRAIMTEHELA